VLISLFACFCGTSLATEDREQSIEILVEEEEGKVEAVITVRTCQSNGENGLHSLITILL
jgi:hypothetical protein